MFFVRSFGCAFFVIGRYLDGYVSEDVLSLFNAITDALEKNNIEEIKASLIKAQQETEEIYVSWDEKGNIIKF